MQTLGKANNTDKSVTQACLINLNRNELTMSNRVGLLAFILVAGLIMTTGNVRAEHASPTLAADSQLENTGRNARDSGGGTLTAEDQKETSGDIKITAAIRRSVVRHKSLSLDAHNAKIITRNGVVTLRGPVENSAEKAKLESIARKTRGVKQVDNQLEPKTP
jgi:hyperosmotically inducible protein